MSICWLLQYHLFQYSESVIFVTWWLVAWLQIQWKCRCVPHQGAIPALQRSKQLMSQLRLIVWILEWQLGAKYEEITSKDPSNFAFLKIRTNVQMKWKHDVSGFDCLYTTSDLAFKHIIKILPTAFFFSSYLVLFTQTSYKKRLNVNDHFFGRLHEQLNESDDAAQCYMLYIQDIFSCGVSVSNCPNMCKFLTPVRV